MWAWGYVVCPVTHRGRFVFWQRAGAPQRRPHHRGVGGCLCTPPKGGRGAVHPCGGGPTARATHQSLESGGSGMFPSLFWVPPPCSVPMQSKAPPKVIRGQGGGLVSWGAWAARAWVACPRVLDEGGRRERSHVTGVYLTRFSSKPRIYIIICFSDDAARVCARTLGEQCSALHVLSLHQHTWEEHSLGWFSFSFFSCWWCFHLVLVVPLGRCVCYFPPPSQQPGYPPSSKPRLRAPTS